MTSGGHGAATVELTFSALPSHVRTARLIATAVARLSGVDEALLDEVRLAVGEACLHAVDAHQRHQLTDPVRLTLGESTDRFEAVVTDGVVEPTPAPEPAGASANGDGALPAERQLGLAIIAGLADDVQFSQTATGAEIRMSWPVKR